MIREVHRERSGDHLRIWSRGDSPAGGAPERSVYVEYSGLTGPSSYAMLGGALSENPGVHLSEPLVGEWSEALVRPPEQVTWGLLDEYLVALSGITGPGGRVRIDTAAHGHIGSSIVAVQSVGLMVEELLGREDPADLSDEDLWQMFRRTRGRDAMSFFTRQWTNGELTEEEFEAAIPAYADHLDQIAGQFTDGVRSLAQEVNLHDGQIESWSYDRGAATFSIRILIGDLQRGYEWLDLDYRGADVVPSEGVLRQIGLDQDGSEVLWDEVHVVGSRFEHRVLMWPEGEWLVRFAEVSVTRSAAAAESRR